MGDGQAFTEALTPDLNDGGYMVQCREITGTVSQVRNSGPSNIHLSWRSISNSLTILIFRIIYYIK
jgi:hypothetical protein